MRIRRIHYESITANHPKVEVFLSPVRGHCICFYPAPTAACGRSRQSFPRTSTMLNWPLCLVHDLHDELLVSQFAFALTIVDWFSQLLSVWNNSLVVIVFVMPCHVMPCTPAVQWWNESIRLCPLFFTLVHQPLCSALNSISCLVDWSGLEICLQDVWADKFCQPEQRKLSKTTAWSR